MPGSRALKLAEQIRVIAAEMLERRIKDPRLGFVTVTECRLTGDSREATLFYTVYGTPEEAADTAAALEAARGQIRTQVGRQLGLRYAPSITFVPDALPETSAHMEELLNKARASDEAVAQQRASAQYAGEADPYKKKDEPADDDDV